MKLFRFIFGAACLSAAVGAFAVESAVCVFVTESAKPYAKRYNAEKVADNVSRIVIPKGDVPKDINFIEVIADSAVVKKGSEGYWIFPRGDYGTFKHESGGYRIDRCVMPFIGVKSPKETFVAIADGMKSDMQAFVRVDEKGFYKVAMRWGFGGSYGAYEDISIDFHTLPDTATYVDMAKVYRNKRLAAGEIVPLRERAKNNEVLQKIAGNVLARIADFGAKKNPKDYQMADFTPATEPKMDVYLTFDKAGELLGKIKDAGMTDLTIVLSGWQYGGADGAAPSVFPIPEEFGGEEGLRKLLKTGEDYGMLLSANANHTDAYTVSKMWNMDFIAKNKNGSLRCNGVLAGGNMYYICIKRSWNLFIKQQMERTRKLGFKYSYYIDVFSALPPPACFDPKHPANRGEIAKYHNMILKYARKLFGGTASECGFDHCMGNLDYINYVSSMDYQMKRRWGVDIYKGGIVKNTLVEGILPVWEIVYHGIVVSTPGRVTQNHPMFGAYENSPEDLVKLAEFGGRPIVYVVRERTLPVLKKMYDFYRPLRHLQFEFIEDHRKLADGVFLTTFSNGERIVSNYNKTEFEFEGRKVAPVNYLLIEKTREGA